MKCENSLELSMHAGQATLALAAVPWLQWGVCHRADGQLWLRWDLHFVEAAEEDALQAARQVQLPGPCPGRCKWILATDPLLRLGG
jgi:hypothetical protein